MRFVSDRSYVPAMNVGPLDTVPAPEIGVGPFAVSVKSAATAVPPLSLTTCLTSVSSGAMSSFVIVHVALSASASVSDEPARVPPVQVHVPGAYPGRFVSERS